MHDHEGRGTTTTGSAAKSGSRRRLRRWELRELAQITARLSVTGTAASFERRGIKVNLVQNASGKAADPADKAAGEAAAAGARTAPMLRSLWQ